MYLHVAAFVKHDGNVNRARVELGLTYDQWSHRFHRELSRLGYSSNSPYKHDIDMIRALLAKKIQCVSIRHKPQRGTFTVSKTTSPVSFENVRNSWGVLTEDGFIRSEDIISIDFTPF